MGLRANTSYKKSARVVGEVLGKYHPHSDAAVYDAMARMAQDFSMRYPMVDGQGNFGSIDGDPPAAMRYTEARMAKAAMEMLVDIQKETVDYIPNFDESLGEPTVLPAQFPNLLVNGATGIAVGMSTNIPPHNLGEVVDAIHYMIQNWRKVDDLTVDDLMQYVTGPDFPTGGIIIDDNNGDGLAKAYGQGKGKITLQAKVHIEEMGRGRERIIVTELPYMTNKSSLIERIASLSRDGKIDGISDLRDESDRQGMRIVIELSRNTDVEDVLSKLYSRTQMRNTFGINMLALVNGEPRLLSLKQALKVFILHRLEIVKRRSEYDLKRAKDRQHLLEGLRVALKNLDEIIDLIRNSRNVDTARKNLKKRFKLSDIQAQAILDMPLRRLAALERKKIDIEYKEVTKKIKELETLLGSDLKMRRVVASELEEIKKTYGDLRKTQVASLGEEQSKKDMLTARDLIADEEVWVSVSDKGLISRTIDKKSPRRSGSTAPLMLVKANARDVIYLVTETGEMAAVPVHSLPISEDPTQGEDFHKIFPLPSGSLAAAAFSLPPASELQPGRFILTGTVGGMVKKSELEELPGAAAQSSTLVKVKDDDALGWVEITDGKQDVMMFTRSGMAIRFSEDDVRPMGLVAAGVNGIKLKGDDEVVTMLVPADQKDVFLVASNGDAKRVNLKDFPTQGRYGQGVTVWKFSGDDVLVSAGTGKPNTVVTVHLQNLAAKMKRLDDAPARGRPAGGKTLFEVRKGDGIWAVTYPWIQPKDLKT